MSPSLSPGCSFKVASQCALRTDRPYRDAWPSEKVLAYIEERSGVEFDGQVAHAFTRMMQEWEPNVSQLAEDEEVPEG